MLLLVEFSFIITHEYTAKKEKPGIGSSLFELLGSVQPAVDGVHLAVILLLFVFAIGSHEIEAGDAADGNRSSKYGLHRIPFVGFIIYDVPYAITTPRTS